MGLLLVNKFSLVINPVLVSSLNKVGLLNNLLPDRSEFIFKGTVFLVLIIFLTVFGQLSVLTIQPIDLKLSLFNHKMSLFDVAFFSRNFLLLLFELNNQLLELLL